MTREKIQDSSGIDQYTTWASESIPAPASWSAEEQAYIDELIERIEYNDRQFFLKNQIPIRQASKILFEKYSKSSNLLLNLWDVQNIMNHLGMRVIEGLRRIAYNLDRNYNQPDTDRVAKQLKALFDGFYEIDTGGQF